MHVVPIPLEKLRPHPKNPRGPDDDLDGLLTSIRTHGLLAPLVVCADEEGDGYTVLAGHRRMQAVRELSWDSVPCHVVDGAGARAMEVLLAEGLHHREPDPLLAADCVRTLLDGGLSVREVADHLGKTPRWVAQRRAMTALSPVAVEAYRAGGLPGFTADMLAMLATVAPEVQEEILDLEHGHGQFTAEEIAAQVADNLRELGKAPWDLDDGDVLPKAGACARCPKTSIACPGLFDDEAEQDGDLSRARCLDSACWARKLEAHVERRQAELREKHPDLVLVAGDLVPGQVAAPQGALPPWAYKRAKKGAPDTVPALIVAGKGAGSVITIERPKVAGKPKAAEKESASRAAPAGEARKGPTLEERLASLERRRKAWVVDNVRDHVERRLPAPDLRHLMALLVAYGADTGVWSGPDAEGQDTLRTRQARHERVYGAEKPGKYQDAWCRIVWDGVRLRIGQRLLRASAEELENQHAEARWVCDLLGVSFAEHSRMAEAEIPTPKVLAAELARQPVASPPTPKRARRGARGKAAAAGEAGE